MKDYMGEKFLNEVYANLPKDEAIRHIIARTLDMDDEMVERKVPETFRRTRVYLDRIEDIHKRAGNRGLSEYFKHFYHERYIVKKEDLPTTMSERVKESRIEEQKRTLDAWIDYLMDPSLKYPMWLKYWIFHEVLKMGAYKNGKYMARTFNTFAPFLEVDPIVVESWFHDIMKRMEAANDNKDIRRIVRDFNFPKMYLAYESKRLEEVKKRDEGRWISYQMGNKKDAERLCSSLQGKVCKWCTKDSGTAQNQIAEGDFYVFYTRDEQGQFTNPRIAIRMNGKNEIAEIRGIGDSQELELDMVDVLIRKLSSMTFLSQEDVQRNLKIVDDLRQLNLMRMKVFNGEELSVEEIVKLYSVKFGFGFANEGVELINYRSISSDFETIEKSDISSSKKYAILDSMLKNLTGDFLAEHQDIILRMFQESNGQYGLIGLTTTNLETNIELVKRILLDGKNRVNLLFLPKDFKERHQDIVLEIFKASQGAYGFEDLTEETMEANLELIRVYLKMNEYKLADLSKEFKLRHQDIVLEVFKASHTLSGFDDLTEETMEEIPELIRFYLKMNEYELSKLSKEFKLRHQDIVLEVFKASHGAYGFNDLTEETMEANLELIRVYLNKNRRELKNLSEEFKFRHQDIVLEIFKGSQGIYGFEDLTDETMEKNLELMEELLLERPWLLSDLSSDFKKKHPEIVLRIFMDSGGIYGLEDLDEESLKKASEELKKMPLPRSSRRYYDDWFGEDSFDVSDETDEKIFG